MVEIPCVVYRRIVVLLINVLLNIWTGETVLIYNKGWILLESIISSWNSNYNKMDRQLSCDCRF